MRTIKFSGKTSSESLQKALFELGDDAHVLGTKKTTINNIVSYITSVEIEKNHPKFHDIFDTETPTVAVEEPIPKKIVKVENLKDQHQQKSEEYIRSNETIQNDIEYLKNQLLSLSSNISNMSHFVLHQNDSATTTPPEFGSIEHTIDRLKLAETLKHNILKFMIRSVPIPIKKDAYRLEMFFVKLLHKMIRTLPEPIPSSNKVMMFCGPTGVGKTTSIAKLSARIMIEFPNTKIGIISLDNYKVGAFKQLEAYADTLKLPIISISSAKELIMAISKLRDCNYIMIDTAGTSQYDVDRIRELHDFVFYHSKIKIEKNLVIPANIKYDDAHDILESFSVVGLDSITLTKLDETKSFGEIFSFLFECPIPINYLGVGQSVPDDFIPATTEYIVSKLLENRSKSSTIKTRVG